EKEDGDVFFKFGEKGAFTNAFTSFTKTAYLFSSTSRVEENLETLIDFVQEPYFTEETVEKEKGIIGQEIRMY
ncbi:insulinase family protein, partial [Escherichia coli]|nr:insulinase family protein [Escherichia coli]